jgi:hypothetical protein
MRKLIAVLVRENGQRDAVIGKLEERVLSPCPKEELRIISSVSFIALRACLKLLPKFV